MHNNSLFKQGGPLETALAGILSAGAGSAALGGMAKKTEKSDETPEERKKRIRDSYILGAVLAGTGGASFAGLVPSFKEPTVREKIKKSISSNILPLSAAAVTAGIPLGVGMGKSKLTLGQLARFFTNPKRRLATLSRANAGKAIGTPLIALLSGIFGWHGGKALQDWRGF